MTFTNQAQDLAEELTQLGVTNELNLYPKEEDELTHEYQFNYSLEQSVDNYKKATAFLEKYLKQ